MAGNEPILALKNLHTHFRTEDGLVKAVDGIDLELQPEQVLGVVGESGSGKSVTALSILRLIPQPPGEFPSGEIQFSGFDLLQASEDELEKIRGNRISMIFQDPMTSLNPYLTVGRQLTEVLELHRNLTGEQANDEAAQMLERVGIPDARARLKAYPHEFSGGMRQRVMVAMALLCDPEVLIADEPTTALDVTVQAQILELIDDLRQRKKTSVILITHDLGVVAGMTQQVAVMYAGRVVEYADTEDLFEHPLHPYTQGLLRSVPRLDQVDAELETIPGMPPDLSNLPTGCPFRPRCPLADDRCAEESPELITLATAGAKHAVRCFNVTAAGGTSVHPPTHPSSSEPARETP